VPKGEQNPDGMSKVKIGEEENCYLAEYYVVSKGKEQDLGSLPDQSSSKVKVMEV